MLNILVKPAKILGFKRKKRFFHLIYEKKSSSFFVIFPLFFVQYNNAFPHKNRSQDLAINA